MHLYKILFLLMIVTLSSCRKDEIFEPIDSEIEIPSPENVDDNLINGTINDDAFRPLSDVTVQLYDSNILIEETQTTSDGSFYFIVDEIKDYILYVESPLYENLITSVNPSNDNNDIKINLQPNIGSVSTWDIDSYDWISIEGKVFNDDGSPSVNTTILFADFPGEFFNYTTTNTAGYYKSTIPADVYILLYIEQACSTGSENEFIFSDRDVLMDDVILNNQLAAVVLSGFVRDCNNDPITSGEITFYDDSYFLGESLLSNVLQVAPIVDGAFSTEIYNVCDSPIHFEAIDIMSLESIYGEINQIDSSVILEELVICNASNSDGFITVEINSEMYSLEDYFAFQNENFINVYGFNISDFIKFDFDADMVEAVYPLEQLVMHLGDEVYHSSGLSLDVTITEYPQSNQGNIVGHIEGQIRNTNMQLVSFALQFDIPLF